MIRVFVGTDSDIHGKAEKVVEYSCRVNTSQDIDFQFIRPGWKNSVTGFSSHRYLIPKLCNYEGFAIYLDVDMLVVGDLAELWSYQRPGKWAITERNPNKISRKARFRDEVAVIDCSAARNVIPNEAALKRREGKDVAKQALQFGRFYEEVIPRTWNARLATDDGVKLIHYTNLNTQPWCPDPRIDYQPFPCKITEDLFWEYLERAERELPDLR